MKDNNEILIDSEIFKEWKELGTGLPNLRKDLKRWEKTKYDQEKEKKYLCDRWDKTGLMKGIESDYKGVVAVLLENQRLMNEAMIDVGDVAQFKRISIPLVRRILGGLTCRHLISIQPMLGTVGLVYYFKNNKLVTEEVVAKTRKLKAVWRYEATQDLRAVHGLDAEVELTLVLALEITMEFNRIVLTDIKNCAALKKTVDFTHLGTSDSTLSEKFAKVQDLVFDLAVESQELYGRPFANWIVTDPKMAKAICPNAVDDKSMNPDKIFSSGLGITERGTISTDKGDIKIWEDVLMPAGSIILGYKGDHPNDAGYVLSPYILLTQSPVVLDPDTFVPRKGLLSRFGQSMVDPTYYSTLTVNNFVNE